MLVNEKQFILFEDFMLRKAITRNVNVLVMPFPFSIFAIPFQH